MSASSRRNALAERKEALVAESARARIRMRAKAARFEATGAPIARLARSTRPLLREPLVLSAAAVGLALFGPRRLVRLVRWTVVTLPLHPLGRRLMQMVGSRVLDAFDGSSPRRR